MPAQRSVLAYLTDRMIKGGVGNTAGDQRVRVRRNSLHKMALGKDLAEWDYVARAHGPSHHRLSVGEHYSREIIMVVGANGITKQTAPVGSFKPNASASTTCNGNVRAGAD
jgi:hypothetical protein